MSSATSIDTPKLRLNPDVQKPGAPNGPATAGGLTAGQFFLLVGLGCATAATVMARGQGVLTIVLLTVLIGTTALVGLAALRTLNPLVTQEDDRTPIIGGRTRAAFEREKVLVLRSIKELEFDRAMGKVSESDFDEMSTRLRSRAARLMRALDAGAGYRDQIEKDLAKRLGAEGSPEGASDRSASRACACGTTNDRDAKFCKSCGRQL